MYYLNHMISKPSEVDGTPHFTEAAEVVRCLMLYREVSQFVYGSPETDLGSFDLKAAWLFIQLKSPKCVFPS